jgi:hypothetical protein
MLHKVKIQTSLHAQMIDITKQTENIVGFKAPKIVNPESKLTFSVHSCRSKIMQITIMILFHSKFN